jgi:hypothetical protein
MHLLDFLWAIWKVSDEDASPRHLIKIGILCVTVAARAVFLVRLI